MIKPWLIGGRFAPLNVSVPVITGTARPGLELSCSTGTWAGFPTPVLTYQWQHGTTNIAGETNNTYTMTDFSYIGETLRCVVTGTNDHGTGDGISANTASVTVALADSVAGGYYIGQASDPYLTTYYYHVIAPITDRSGPLAWGAMDTTTGITDNYAGPANTTSLAALGAAYEAAVFCEDSVVQSQSDWFLPSYSIISLLDSATRTALQGISQWFGYGAYWLSTEAGKDTAWMFIVASLDGATANKSDTAAVAQVRRVAV